MAGQRPVNLYDPISDTVQAALAARVDEYSKTRNVNFWIGTWNLNGTTPGEGLGPWMFPNGKAEWVFTLTVAVAQRSRKGTLEPQDG
jgi:synaptojanin